MSRHEKISHVQFGLGIDGNSQGILALVRGLVFPMNILEDGIRLADTFDGLGLLHTSQTISQAVENIADRVFAGQVFVVPAFLFDQRLMHALGRHPRVLKRGLKLGVLLAFRFGQRANIVFQLWQFLFGFAIATSRKIVPTRDSRSQLVQSQFHRLAIPTKHPFRATSTAVEVVQSHLRLKGSSLGSRQLLGGILDRRNLQFRQRVQRPLLGDFGNPGKTKTLPG